jgi:small conductance mechanosensitive channel
MQVTLAPDPDPVPVDLFSGMPRLYPMPQPAASPDSSRLDVVTAQVDVSIDTLYDQVDRLVDGLVRMLPNLVIALVVFGLFVVAGKLVRQGLHRAWHGRRGDLFTGLLVAMSIVVPSIGGGELVQILGVGGVAIGFAFRDILQNFLAGILLLLRRPFYIGDQIVYKDYEGTIEDIETRATFVRTYDGTRVIIPNSELFTNPVRVQTAFEARRSEFDIGIHYDDDIETARAAFLDAVRRVDGVLDDPAPQVLTWGLDDSAVTLRVWWWSRPERASVVSTHDRVVTALRYKADEAGITIPFPIRTVYFNDETKRDTAPREAPQPERPAAPEGGTARVAERRPARRKPPEAP